MHKTGSTSIQATLAAASAEPSGKHFPVTLSDKRGNLSVPLYSLFMSEGARHHSHRRRGNDEEKVEEYNRENSEALKAKFRECGNRIAVISGEGLSRLDEEGIGKLKAFLDPWFAQIEIVAYVRSPKSYMESAFQQLLKGGSNIASLESVYPDYQRKFGQFIDVFGRKQVSFWPFAPKTFPNGDVVQDFCKRIGMTIDQKHHKRINESLSLEAVRLLFTYRKLGGNYGEGDEAVAANRALIEFLSSIPGGKLRFAPELVKPVLDANRADIAWMEKMLGSSLADSMEPGKDDIHDEDDLMRCAPASIYKLMARLRDSLGTGAQTVAVDREQRRLARLAKDKAERQNARRAERGNGNAVIEPLDLKVPESIEAALPTAAPAPKRRRRELPAASGKA
jgi:hypothetical protein